MGLQSEQFLPTDRVPHLRGSVLTRRCQTLAVRAPGHALHVVGVALEGEQFLSAVRIPHLRGVVVTCRCQVLSVGAPSHALHATPVALYVLTYRRQQNCLVQYILRSRHRRFVEQECDVDCLHAQKDALFRIVAETFTSKSSQIPSFSLSSIALGFPCL